MTPYKEYDYRYCRDNGTGKIYRLHIEQSEDTWNPRGVRENVGTMSIWWGKYNLGDKNGRHEFDCPVDFLNDLVNELVTDADIINYVKGNRTSNKLEIKYNSESENYELYGWEEVYVPNYYYSTKEYGIVAEAECESYLIDDILDYLTITEKWKLLEGVGISHMPLYIYEHSGLTISLASFHDRWDSGVAGWIWATKEKVMEMDVYFSEKKDDWIKITESNWREAAKYYFSQEVNIYDLYLRGECYDCIKEVYRQEQKEWEYDEISYGHFSDKYNDELIREMCPEIEGNIYSSLDELMEKEANK
jgi:hypothetical protein